MNFQKMIITYAVNNELLIGNTQSPISSLLGTSSICAHLLDGKGIIYCHTSGPYTGETFYLPFGIGWFYKNVLKGSQSAIGLPISNEFILVNKTRIRKVMFEAGTIEFNPSLKICKAIIANTNVVIKEMKL